MHARTILKTYLDEVGQALMTDDWDTFRSAICLPCHIISRDEAKVVATTEDLKAGFDMFRDNLRAQRATDYIRLVDIAKQQTRDQISGRYVTHLIAGSHRLVPPFMSEITLRLIGNRWCAASVSTALANSRWPLMRLEIKPDTLLEGPPE